MNYTKHIQIINLELKFFCRITDVKCVHEKRMSIFFSVSETERNFHKETLFVFDDEELE